MSLVKILITRNVIRKLFSTVVENYMHVKAKGNEMA